MKKKKFKDILGWIFAWVIVIWFFVWCGVTVCVTIDFIEAIVFSEMTWKLFIKWLILAITVAISLGYITHLYKTEMKNERNRKK